LLGKKFDAVKQSRNAVDLRSQVTTLMETRLKSLDDKALIEMILAGHQGCFEALMDRHLGAVRRCVSSMIWNMSDAEDVVQEVQLKVWMHLSSFRHDSSFRTWVTRVANNESLQFHRRTKATRQCAEMNLDQFAASTDSPFQSYAREEMADTVRSAIHRLPAKFQQILILRDLRELTIKETARHLNWNPQMVKKRLSRSRTILSKALQTRKILAPDWQAEIAA
jgi:RNA polymerase sigma-70 factor (ECF subfamily)